MKESCNLNNILLSQGQGQGFFKKKFLFIFIFGCVGSSFLYEGFL